MKNAIKSIALVLAIAATGTATAQNAHESSIKFNKKSENAVVADFNKSAEVVEAALKDRLEKEGLGKMKTSKGFMSYAGTLWNSVSSDKLDVYFKVEGKKDKSTVSVLVSKGYDNFITSGSDAKTIDNVKAFLNGFVTYTNSYQLTLDIKAQEEAIKRAEKAYTNSIDNNKDEEKKKLSDLKLRMN
jgi:hypothetical protein